MKYIKSMDQRTGRLLASLVLSFTVMLFINGFVGSMGGFPALIAFFVVFYRMRTQLEEEKKSPQVLSACKERIRLLLWYGISYLVLWGVLRIAFLISRVTGWGNMRGASVVEFFRNMWETSLLEKWAYLFAGIVMFAFVLSLFPLVLIKKKSRWMRYALIDAAVFALVCLGINAVCSTRFEQRSRNRATCLIDHLLLCGRMKPWQELVCILAAVLFTLVVGAFVCFYVKIQINRAEEKEDETSKKKTLKSTVAVLGSVAAVIIVAVIIFLMPEDTADGYVKVAEFLTKDSRMAPVEYGGTVYIPVNEDPALDESGTAQGYLAEKGENCDSRFYRMAVANLLYTDTTGRTQLVQAQTGTYAPAKEVEKEQLWEKDDVFLLWDEDWVSESAYSHEPVGYTACAQDLISGLRMQFPDVTYQVADFSDYDAYFTIRGYTDLEQALQQEPENGDWVGCILVKDDKFYFGSYKNRITGICLQQLRDVLGGNAK